MMDAVGMNNDVKPVPKTIGMLKPMGTIGPEGKVSSKVIDHVCEAAVSDKAYSETTDNSVDHCYDGRPNKDGNKLGAKAAGGTITLAAGLALRDKHALGEKAPQHTGRVAREARARGKKVGGHIAIEVHGDHSINCGCGAADKEDAAFVYIAAHRDELKTYINDLGIDVSDELSEEIGLQAQKLVDEQYALNQGPNTVNALREVGGNESIEELEGDHREVVAVLNLREGTSLDKDKLRELVGADVQVFGVDVWAIKQNAYELESNPIEAHKLFVAMLYYNLGVAAVLCNASLRVVVRK